MATHLKFFLHVVLLGIAFGVCVSHDEQEELRIKETNQDKIIRLGHPMQYRSADPSKVIQLSWQPRVFLYMDFLSNEECDYLISWVHGKKSHTAPGNDSAVINTTEIPGDFNISMDADDEIASRIEERISAWTFLPKDHSLSLQILHFGSEGSKQNYNYFNKESTEQVDQPLLATVILYLSDISQGGQIIFPHSKSKVLSDCTRSSDILRPRKGNAIVFFNSRLNASPDTTSYHARCPMPQGDMWCATKFLYLQKVVAPKRDPPHSETDDPDCTDEDEDCAHWAAIGECERNPIFMIGTPDYFGACRKSCHACHQ